MHQSLSKTPKFKTWTHNAKQVLKQIEVMSTHWLGRKLGKLLELELPVAEKTVNTCLVLI